MVSILPINRALCIVKESLSDDWRVATVTLPPSMWSQPAADVEWAFPT